MGDQNQTLPQHGATGPETEAASSTKLGPQTSSYTHPVHYLPRTPQNVPLGHQECSNYFGLKKNGALLTVFETVVVEFALHAEPSREVDEYPCLIMVVKNTNTIFLVHQILNHERVYIEVTLGSHVFFHDEFEIMYLNLSLNVLIK